MTNRNYERGRNAEYRTIRRLEAQGYVCTRSAGSHGLWDVWAYIPTWGFRLIQVKYGCGASEGEIEGLELEEVPQMKPTSKELWTWMKGATQPEVRIL